MKMQDGSYNDVRTWHVGITVNHKWNEQRDTLHIVDGKYDDIRDGKVVARCGAFTQYKSTIGVVTPYVPDEYPKRGSYDHICERCESAKGPRKTPHVKKSMDNFLHLYFAQLKKDFQKEAEATLGYKTNVPTIQSSLEKRVGRYFRAKVTIYVDVMHEFLSPCRTEEEVEIKRSLLGMLRQEMVDRAHLFKSIDDTSIGNYFSPPVAAVSRFYRLPRTTGVFTMTFDIPNVDDALTAIHKGLESQRDKLVDFMYNAILIYAKASIIDQAMILLFRDYTVDDKFSPWYHENLPIWRTWLKLGTVQWIKPYMDAFVFPFNLTFPNLETYGNGQIHHHRKPRKKGGDEG
jgi:hypothetical protein